MKTKLLIAAILILMSAQSGFSQDYHPLLNNTTWVLTRTVSCCVPLKIKVINPGTEVVIGDYTYTAFTDPLPQHDSNSQLITTVYLREDIAARKVYKIVEGIDTLLYDYSMETDDTITQDGFTWAATVDEIETNVGMRKRITLIAPFDNNHNVKQIWIEGIGSNKHPFYPQHNMTAPFQSAGGGVNIHTACVYQDGQHIFGGDDCDTMLATTAENYLDNAVVFSPNPVTAEFTISSAIALQNGSLQLYNAQGQLVRETTNLTGRKNTIQRENLSPGLYLAQLYEEGELVKSEKLIID